MRAKHCFDTAIRGLIVVHRSIRYEAKPKMLFLPWGSEPLLRMPREGFRRKGPTKRSNAYQYDHENRANEGHSDPDRADGRKRESATQRQGHPLKHLCHGP